MKGDSLRVCNNMLIVDRLSVSILNLHSAKTLKETKRLGAIEFINSIQLSCLI